MQANVANAEDALTELLDSHEGNKLIGKWTPTLEIVFHSYCTSSDEKDDDLAALTMDMEEWICFLTEAGFLGPKLTMREARGIFVQVNLDDDMYVQEDAANNSSELVLVEFIECIFRAALEITGFAVGSLHEGDYTHVVEILDGFMTTQMESRAERLRAKLSNRRASLANRATTKAPKTRGQSRS